MSGYESAAMASPNGSTDAKFPRTAWETGTRLAPTVISGAGFPPGTTYLEATQDIETQLERAMWFAVDGIYHRLCGGQPLSCGGQEGLRALSVGEMLRSAPTL